MKTDEERNTPKVWYVYTQEIVVLYQSVPLTASNKSDTAQALDKRRVCSPISHRKDTHPTVGIMYCTNVLLRSVVSSTRAPIHPSNY